LVYRYSGVDKGETLPVGRLAFAAGAARGTGAGAGVGVGACDRVGVEREVHVSGCARRFIHRIVYRCRKAIHHIAHGAVLAMTRIQKSLKTTSTSTS
jgi:hypothetical protein